MGSLISQFFGKKEEISLLTQVEQGLATFGFQFDQGMNNQERNSIYEQALLQAIQINSEGDIIPAHIFFKKTNSPRYISETAVLHRSSPYGEVQPEDTLTFYKTQASPEDFLMPSPEPVTADKVAEYTVEGFLEVCLSMQKTAPVRKLWRSISL